MDNADWTENELSYIYYGGSEHKLGILIDGQRYMLKFQKKTPFGLRYNHISEYLGSHIYRLLGFDCQDTLLGTYQAQNVVACKDFVTDGCQFVPFNDVGESTLDEDKENYQYDYHDIVCMLEANKKLTNVRQTVEHFFEMFIVDALLGNFDRHGGNWGFLKENNQYRLAPIFDNGSCLYPNMTNPDEMTMIISDQNEINRRVYTFPTSQIKLNGEKSSYYEVISSLMFDEVNAALNRIFPKIVMSDIYNLIDEINEISDIHKQFYKTMLKNRYELILQTSFEKLQRGQQ